MFILKSKIHLKQIHFSRGLEVNIYCLHSIQIVTSVYINHGNPSCVVCVCLLGLMEFWDSPWQSVWNVQSRKALSRNASGSNVNTLQTTKD